jgi:DNA-binding NarL/FixJ family response regulator
MPRVYLVDSQSEERSALRLLLLDLKMEVVGEATDWATILIHAPLTCLDMLLVDWELMPKDINNAITELREVCPKVVIIALISHFTPNPLHSLPVGADAFISKDESPRRAAERLLAAAKKVFSQ